MEKRIYSSGFHIEWNSNNRNLVKKKSEHHTNGRHKKQKKLGPLEQSNTPNYNSNEEMDLTVTASLDDKSIVLVNREIINLATIQDSKSNKQEISINSSIKSDIKNETIKIPKDSDPVPEANTLSLLSFISAILSIIALITFSSALVGGIGILLAIIALPLGAIALRQFRRNPEKYRNKGLAIAGVIIGYSLSSLFLLGSLLAAAWFGSFLWLIIAGLFLSNIIVSTIILSRKNSTLP
jgi:hypothetical protein|tara:strand:+ start:583 stop:1296 length:714 start_codon:yes stop_codon:yes gene_type:complete